MRSLFPACIILLLFSGVIRESRVAETSATEHLTQVPPGCGGPIAWAPFRQKYVTTEQEPLLIVIHSDCPSVNPTGEEFEILEPTPSFVHLSQVLIPANPVFCPRAVTIVTVSPQLGDAGKYELRIRASSCGGGVGGVVAASLKVKKAPRN
jgi:hypothetical protein